MKTDIFDLFLVDKHYFALLDFFEIHKSFVGSLSDPNLDRVREERFGTVQFIMDNHSASVRIDGIGRMHFGSVERTSKSNMTNSISPANIFCLNTNKYTWDVNPRIKTDTDSRSYFQIESIWTPHDFSTELFEILMDDDCLSQEDLLKLLTRLHNLPSNSYLHVYPNITSAMKYVQEYGKYVR